MDKLNGIVKFFKKDMFWGFITADTGKDYFFHGNNVEEQDELYVGEKVLFETVETSKGIMAINVERERRSPNSVGEETTTKETNYNTQE